MVKRERTTPKGRHRRKTLAVRMLVARVDWLDWPVRWSDGRMVWCDGNRMLAPTVDDLASAVRCLNKIPAYPIAARAVLGDVDAWITRKRRRIDLVRDLKSVTVDITARDDRSELESSIGKLTAALIPESLSGDLPFRPSAALVRIGRQAQQSLHELINKDYCPERARIPAALVRGAIEYAHCAEERLEAKLEGELRIAHEYGRLHGLPEPIDLYLTVLAGDGGSDLAVRLTSILSCRRADQLADAHIRRVFEGATSPRGAIEALEALGAPLAISPALRRMEHFLPKRLSRQSTKMLLRYSRHHRNCCENLAAHARHLLIETARQTGQAVAVESVNRLMGALFSRVELGSDCLREMSIALKSAEHAISQGTRLAPELFPDFIALVESTAPSVERQYLELRIDQIVALALRSGSLEFARRAIEGGFEADFRHVGWPASDVYTLVLDAAESLGKAGHNLVGLIRQADSGRAGRRALPQLMRALSRVPDDQKGRLLSLLTDEYWTTDLDFEKYLAAVIPHLMLMDVADDIHRDIARALIRIACHFHEHGIDIARAEACWAKAALDEVPKSRMHGDLWSAIDIGLKIAFLTPSSSEEFRAILLASSSRSFDISSYSFSHGVRWLSNRPPIARIVKDAFPSQPHRCVGIVAGLGNIDRFLQDAQRTFSCIKLRDVESAADHEFPDSPYTEANVSVDAPLITIGEYLRSSGDHFDVSGPPDRPRKVPNEAIPGVAPQVRIDTGLVPLVPEAGWYRLCVMFPIASADATEYLQCATVGRTDLQLPKSLRRAVDARARAEREIAFLKAAIAGDSDRVDLAKRLERRMAIVDESNATADGEKVVLDALAELLPRVRLQAVETLVDDVYRGHLTIIAGPDHSAHLPTKISPDLRNAVALAMAIKENRKLLLRLIRHHLANDADWRERHPKNAELLKALADTGANVRCWLSEFPRSFRCADIEGGAVHLRVERDPLRIMQMGNRFGTCLSLGGINAFSTVANACELNKRVIFAYDGQGRMVARKLVGLDEKFSMLGFYTYTNGSRGYPSTHLAEIVDRYARAFADACGLKLADEGTVPKLFAEDWYDDGCKNWADSSAASAMSTSLRRTRKRGY